MDHYFYRPGLAHDSGRWVKLPPHSNLTCLKTDHVP